MMNKNTYHLYTHALCPYVQRSIIILREKNIPYTRTDIDLANKPKWFKKMSPMGKVPVLLVNDDITLFESAVICEYLEEVTPGFLHPNDTLEKAHHRAWIEFGSEILDGIARLYNAKDKNSFASNYLELQRKFQFVENKLSAIPFFSGEKFHMIDAVYAPVFRYFDVIDHFVNPVMFSDLPKIQAWRYALQKRPSVVHAVMPEYPELLMQFFIKRNSYISTLACSSERINKKETLLSAD